MTYAGLASSKYNETAKKILPKGAGALFTVSLKGGYEATKLSPGCIKGNKAKI